MLLRSLFSKPAFLCFMVLSTGTHTVEPVPQHGLFDQRQLRAEATDECFEMAREEVASGDLDAAVRFLQSCVEIDPTHLKSHFMLGVIFYSKSLTHAREADYAFSKVLELQPHHLQALGYRAATRINLGAFEAAEQDFRAVLDQSPDSLRVIRDLANAYLRQNKLAEAIAALRQVVDGRPDDLLARWNLRVAYAQQGGYPASLPVHYRISLVDDGGSKSPVTFTDVAPKLGVATLSHGRGSAWADYDGDGDADLFTVGVSDPHRLYRNNGDGTFLDVTRSAGLVDLRGGWGSLFFDYDRDGDRDLFVTRNGWRGPDTNSLYRNNGNGTFSDVSLVAGFEAIADSFTAAVADVDNDGWPDLYVANGVSQPNGTTNALYRNNRDGTFSDVAERAGVANPGRSIGSGFGDYDNDGLMDLFVINIGGPNALYRNTGNGKFIEVTRQAGIDAPLDGFVGFFFDYDNDGWLDLFACGWAANMEEVLQSAMTGRPSHERNRLALYHNNGDGTFTDVTAEAGLARTYGAMAAQFGDIDNDGYLDIYLGTGAPPMDTYEPNRLFWNRGGGRFLDVTESARVGNLGKGHGATFSDYDNDGDLDLYAPIGGAMPGDLQPNSLYRNNGTQYRWLKLRLVAVKSNLDAIGARVTVVTKEGARHHAIAGGTGFGSMNDPVVSVGLGSAARVERVDIVWPLGIRQSLTNLEANQLVVVIEDSNQSSGIAP